MLKGELLTPFLTGHNREAEGPSENTFWKCFESWNQHCNKCIASQGEFFEGH